MRRRTWLMAGVAAILPTSLRAGDLDDPPLGHPLWRLVHQVAVWARSRPSSSPPELGLAFLRLATDCFRFAQGVSLYLNSMDNEEEPARRFLIQLTASTRRVLLMAERVDPEWRAFVDDSALNSPNVRDWLTTVDWMIETFYAFLRLDNLLEDAARNIADG